MQVDKAALLYWKGYFISCRLIHVQCASQIIMHTTLYSQSPASGVITNTTFLPCSFPEPGDRAKKGTPGFSKVVRLAKIRMNIFFSPLTNHYIFQASVSVITLITKNYIASLDFTQVGKRRIHPNKQRAHPIKDRKVLRLRDNRNSDCRLHTTCSKHFQTKIN